jgi:LuxR family maltose regulon positive regulatory protein
LSCWAHAGLGALLYEWNELAEALPHLRRAVELSQQSGEVKVMMYARISLAQVLQTLGQPDEAWATLQAVTEIAQQTHIVEIARQVDLARIKLWLRQGEVDAAAAWLQQHGVGLQNKVLLPHQLTMLAWLHLAAPQELDSEALARIMDLIKPHYEAALRGQLPLPQVQTLISLALAHQALGQLDKAGQKMALAVATAEPMGLIRTFTDQPGHSTAPLLRQVASRKGNSLYLSRLMAAFEVHQASARVRDSLPDAPADHLIEALSQREVEILQRLADGLSNQEIADELVLAISTVKWYLRNIYDKLQVNRRTQALAKARELNLLDPS